MGFEGFWVSIVLSFELLIISCSLFPVLESLADTFNCTMVSGMAFCVSCCIDTACLRSLVCLVQSSQPIRCCLLVEEAICKTDCVRLIHST
jgi:hypothetical protein